MDNLPVELYSFIFRNLSIKDLINCRLVNKKFKTASYKCIDKLVINDLYEYNVFWFYNNELINEDDIISRKLFRAIKSLSLFNLNEYLKYLRINYVNKELNFLGKELIFLNDFINLEGLEIYSFSDKINCKLNLKNLKYFAVSGFENDDYYKYVFFELNTPKLERIQFRNIENICIKSNPESIKHFITSNYEDQLKIFKNLEIIEFTNPEESDIDENLLSLFNNLKQLKIQISDDLDNFDRVEDVLIKILNNRIKLDREIDIYLEGN